MAIEPLSQWTCDVCRKAVTLENGYVVWDRYTKPDFAFQIIHQRVCDTDRLPSSLPLADFVGADGAAKLTAMLSPGPLILHFVNGNDAEHHPPLDAWVDFFRRVQLPYYEEARLYLSTPEAANDMSDWNEVAPYIRRHLEEFAQRSRELLDEQG